MFFYDEIHEPLIQIEFNVKMAYVITEVILSDTENYVIPTEDDVLHNFPDEFFVRKVIKKCNELKIDYKISYYQSKKEVTWKSPSLDQVKKNDNYIQGSQSYV